MNTLISFTASFLFLMVFFFGSVTGGLLMAIWHIKSQKEEIFELQDRLAELIAIEPGDDDDDDQDPELRPLVPMDPNARVPRDVTPHR